MFKIKSLAESSNFVNKYQGGHTCDEDLKAYFRAVEKKLLKISALISHLSFNETCRDVYIYTNIAMHTSPF